MLKLPKYNLARLVRGYADSNGRKWDLNVSLLCHRRPILVPDFSPAAANIKDYHVEETARLSCLSNWEITDSNQQNMIKERAVGKDAGKDLGFIESLTDVAQKREIQFEEYWPTVVREKAEFYKPTEQLILIDPETNLPPRGSIINGNLQESARALAPEESEISFTSPFPISHYRIGFGKAAKADTGLDGVIVFLLHAYVNDSFGSIVPSEWITSNDLERLKTDSKMNSSLFSIYKEITAVN